MAVEKMLIEHCSATLASIKMANLFNISFDDVKDLEEQICYWNKSMQKKGIHLFVLKITNGKALVYVYRKKSLERCLENPFILDFLRKYGYENGEIEESLNHLKTRMIQNEGFPHEIGVFLDYPLKDVEGFIENKGKNFKISGMWKVYANENETEKLFARYKKCREIYIRLWKQGKSVMQLTVAA